MTEKKMKKQFGVWMDTHQATIVGRADANSTEFTVLGIAGEAGADPGEKTRHHDKSPHLQHRFFKEILFYMHNAEEVHLTGTGTSQEQLMHYMADTPQFKDTITKESISNKMSDENLAAYISAKFN
jgi:hypothetical protein